MQKDNRVVQIIIKHKNSDYLQIKKMREKSKVALAVELSIDTQAHRYHVLYIKLQLRLWTLCKLPVYVAPSLMYNLDLAFIVYLTHGHKVLLQQVCL